MNVEAVAHVVATGYSREEMRGVLEALYIGGVESILALRGDLPHGLSEADALPQDGFHQAADLVHFIKQEFPLFSVGVAGFPEGHPQTRNRLREIDYLKAKVDAGADYIVTQLFFDGLLLFFKIPQRGLGLFLFLIQETVFLSQTGDPLFIIGQRSQLVGLIEINIGTDAF